jgi:hypothetical protein
VIYGQNTLYSQGASKFEGGVDVVNLTASGLFKADYISTSYITASKLVLIDQFTHEVDELFTSTRRLLYHTDDYDTPHELIQDVQLRSSMVAQNNQLRNSLVSTTEGLEDYVSTFVDPAELTSTIISLGTQGFISSLSSFPIVFQSTLDSTIMHLGTAGYISSSQLVSTAQGLSEYISSFIDPTELASSIIGLGSAGFVSSVGLDTKIASTVAGLATANYISSTQLISTVDGIGNTIGPQLTSTVTGLGTANYISSSQLTSTSQGLQEYVSSFIDPTELASTIIGLGSAGFISSVGLDTKLASTVSGLGTADYISSAQLISSVAGIGNAIGPQSLVSTVEGLGTANYVSTQTLQSSISGTLFVSTSGQVVYNQSIALISLPELISTVQSLISQPLVAPLQSYSF